MTPIMRSTNGQRILSVIDAGEVISWMRDNYELYPNAKELAESVFIEFKVSNYADRSSIRSWAEDFKGR